MCRPDGQKRTMKSTMVIKIMQGWTTSINLLSKYTSTYASVHDSQALDDLLDKKDEG